MKFFFDSKVSRHWRFVIFLMVALSGISARAQLLYPESFVVIFDTTKTFKGSISPSVEIKTPKELYVELNNRADLAYRFRNHGLVLANKFELTKNGGETILSGGFIYAKYKTYYDNPFVLEHYGQYQWAEARGMERKIALGSNIRYKIYKKNRGGAFVGIGAFYEYEAWNYTAVSDNRLPFVVNTIDVELIKLNAYVSIKQVLTDKLRGEAAVYLQDNFQNLFESPRIGASSGTSYSITKNVAFAVQFRMLYDFDPIVPVDKLWYSTFTELRVTF